MWKVSTSFFISCPDFLFFSGCNDLPLDQKHLFNTYTLKSILSNITKFSMDKKTLFCPKSFMSLTLQHNRLTFLTCSDLAPYRIYVRVIMALSPKMAPISKINRKQGSVHPLTSTHRSVQIKRATACKVHVTIDYWKSTSKSNTGNLHYTKTNC